MRRTALTIGMLLVSLSALPAGGHALRQTAPASRASVAELVATLETLPSAPARREAARRYLAALDPDDRTQLEQALASASRTVQFTLISVLPEFPQLLSDEMLAPLTAVLLDADAEGRAAAAAALAAFPADRSVPALRRLLADTTRQRRARVACVEALERIGTRAAMEALVAALDEGSQGVAQAAISAISSFAGRSLADAAEARSWWQSARTQPESVWREMELSYARRRAGAAERRARELESRLLAVLRDTYLRAGDAEKTPILLNQLSDALASVRIAGLELVQAALAEGRSVAPEVAARTRDLLDAPEPLVRAAAVRTVAGLRDATDEARFLRMLAGESAAEVRVALANGVGYVGTVASVAPLIALLDTGEPSLADEAVTALGRLAERGVLRDDALPAVADALLAAHERASADRTAMRERLLWSMSRIGDPRFADVFVQALKPEQPAPLRIAALRGIALLTAVSSPGAQSLTSATRPGLWPAETPRRSALLDAVVDALGDPDASVRRAAVETLAQSADSDRDLRRLWSVLADAQAFDAAAREAAWRGAVRLIGAQPLAEIEGWIERLPCDENQDQRCIELLLLAEKRASAEPVDRARLGRIRVRMAEHRVALGQLEPALTAYLAALEDLCAAGAEEAGPVTARVILLALRSDRYDPHLLAQRCASPPAPAWEAFWTALCAALQAQLAPQSAELTLSMLDRLAEQPPVALPDPPRECLQQVRDAALALRSQQDRELVAGLLAQLAANPDDPSPSEAILALGRRAAPIVREALLAAVRAQPPDPHTEARLVELLKRLLPDWPGYALDDQLERKLEALEAART